MDNILIEEARIRGLEPFSIAVPIGDLALGVLPASFSCADNGSSVRLQWKKTPTIYETAEGYFNLYICKEHNLGVWIPRGDWFITNEIPYDESSTPEHDLINKKPDEKNTSHLQKYAGFLIKENSSPTNSSDIESRETNSDLEPTTERQRKRFRITTDDNASLSNQSS